MSNITVGYLAKLGRERKIPSLFERAWVEAHGGGSNPVAKAMQIVENERIRWNRIFLSSAGVALLVPFGIAAWDGLTNKGGSGDAFVHLVRMAFLWFSFLLMLLALEKKGEEVDDAVKSHIAGFCECLDLARSWASLSFELLLPDNEEAIKQIGTDILVDSATDVLQVQEGEKFAESPGEKERLQVSAGNVRAEFTRRYNTLRLIGLASGGYDKYFEIAQRTIDAGSKKSPQAAVI